MTKSRELPTLLHYVQMYIQKERRIFAMTGSSARRLKQASSNLLAGRAFVYSLFPLSTLELGDQFDLKRALEWGTLPDAYFAKSDEHAREYLSAYLVTYLEKEIQQEQWVRKIIPFRKFLQIAGQMNSRVINFAAIGRDVGVDDATVKQYFEILEDTFIGSLLPAFHHSVRRAQRTAPKFFLFDTGVRRALEKTLSVPLVRQTDFGEAFEHWIYLELVKMISYRRLDWTLSYAQSRNGVEIDFIVSRPRAPTIQIEVKSMEKVNAAHAESLETFGRDLDPKADRYLLSRDHSPRRLVRHLLWNGGKASGTSLFRFSLVQNH